MQWISTKLKEARGTGAGRGACSREGWGPLGPLLAWPSKASQPNPVLDT